MFKILQSKLFRYGAIAGLAIATSSVVLSINHNPNVSANTEASNRRIAESNIQSNLKPNIKQNTEPSNFTDLYQLANLPAEQLAERPNLLPSGRILKQLNLSTAQLQKLKEIGDRDRESLQDMTQRAKQGHRELRELLAGSEGSDAIRAKHDQLLNLQKEIRQKHFERMLSMREVLTPEQRSQLNQVIHKNRSMRDGMKERLEKRLDKRNKVDS